MRFTFQAPEKKVIVVLPAYNAEKTLEATIGQIPNGSFDEIILVDDASTDRTSEVAMGLVNRVVIHKENRGYGANQKTCYTEALQRGADIVVMVHPDNQYNPMIIPNMVLPIYLGQAEVVFASRFIQDPLRGGPIAGGMPITKYFVNRGMTTLQNWLMGTYFTEFHTGYRAYSRNALENVDFMKLSDDFLFDNQIIAQMVAKGITFHQIGVETRYFRDASSINFRRGVVYALGCLGVGVRYFLHRKNISKWSLVG